MKNSNCSLRRILIVLSIVFIGFTNFFSTCVNEQQIRCLSGAFPVKAVNFESLNSEWDDYNSGPPPTIDGFFSLYYSTKMYSQGKNFDIVQRDVYYTFDKHSCSFSMYSYDYNGRYNYNYLEYINTQYNEFGPNFQFSEGNRQFYFYSSDSIGKQKIYCMIINYNYGGVEHYPFPVNILNSNGYNDGYLTIDSVSKNIYFMSDRNGNYDIFRRSYPASGTFYNWLLTTSSSLVEKVEELSTIYNDKCPYINGKLMVFTSDRPGGYGGYDLWYSTLQDGKWSVPKNFGPDINSEYDEYRPVVMVDERFGNDLMMFSSNRPGGKGGFDLYYVGIPKMTN